MTALRALTKLDWHPSENVPKKQDQTKANKLKKTIINGKKRKKYCTLSVKQKTTKSRMMKKNHDNKKMFLEQSLKWKKVLSLFLCPNKKNFYKRSLVLLEQKKISWKKISKKDVKINRNKELLKVSLFFWIGKMFSVGICDKKVMF